jgi:hypothetical protein
MTRLTSHFTLEEFQQASDVALTADEHDNAVLLAIKLEGARRALGDQPLVVTSFVRAADAGSQHRNGEAVDVRPPRTLTQRQIYDALTAAAAVGALGEFGQLIFYPFSDLHVHVSLPGATRRNEVLIADADEAHYAPPSPALIASIPGSVLGAGALLLAAGVYLWLRTRGA